MKRYQVIACHVLWRELCHFAAHSPNVFQFNFLEQGLHNTPDILRAEVQQAVNNADETCDAVLLGYGLCSNGVAGIRATSKPLVIMRGHDCVTFLLGSKERYREYFDANPGTYWYSPGWIDTNQMPSEERYNRYLHEYTEKYGDDNAGYLMEMEQDWIVKYSKAAYVDLGFSDSHRYKQYTRECAGFLKWNYEELSGESKLMEDFLAGNWDAENFLVVEPGQEVQPSHDEFIIKAVDIAK